MKGRKDILLCTYAARNVLCISQYIFARDLTAGKLRTDIRPNFHSHRTTRERARLI